LEIRGFEAQNFTQFSAISNLKWPQKTLSSFKIKHVLEPLERKFNSLLGLNHSDFYFKVTIFGMPSNTIIGEQLKG